MKVKALLATLLASAGLAAAQAPPPANSALMNPAALKEQAPDLYRVNFETTKGVFVVEVRRAWAPRGADRFFNLVKNGFFTDCSFFRYVSGFIVQFGIPADPKVARVWYRANIPDDPVKQGNTQATLVFATAGPNTRTTQLFINLGDNTQSLDGQGFAAFGKVIKGMDVVGKIYSGYGEKPDQGRIQNEGKTYLDKNFPKLDSIKSATIVPQDEMPKGKKK
jgi:peptidyl-prolyl cis-trans isomerase A (cyclophilin A)